LRIRKRDTTPEHRAMRRVCHRFLQALMLHDVISERDERQIAQDFSIRNHNDIPRLQEAASRHAGQVASVCGPMGWGDMEVLVTRLQDRITAGAQEEILCLTSIPMIGAVRARVLYTAGYRTPEAILKMSPKKLASVLESCRGSKGGEMRAAKTILQGARRLCEEQRRAVREESEAKLRELEQLPDIDEDDEGGATDTDDGDEGAAGVTLDVRAARGTVVVRDPAALAALAEHWRGDDTYAFCLQPASAGGGGLGPASLPPAAIALAFASNPRATFYVPIVMAAKVASAPLSGSLEKIGDDSGGGSRSVRQGQVVSGGGQRREVTRGFPWELVRDILATGGGRKVTIDLKPQLRAMGAANAVANSTADAAAAAAAAAVPETSAAMTLSTSSLSLSGGGSGSDRGSVIGTVAGPVVDVRIAGWLLHPDAAALSCGAGTGWVRIGVDSESSGPAESLLRFFGTEVDVLAVRAAAAWPLGLTKSSQHHAAAAATSVAAAAALAIDTALRLRLAENDPELERALNELEMPLVPVLAYMEAIGVGFAPEALKRQLRQAKRRLREIEVECACIIARVGAAPASLTSSGDVERVLFEDLKLPVPPCAVIGAAIPGARKSKRRFKTNAEVWEGATTVDYTRLAKFRGLMIMGKHGDVIG